MKTEFAPCRYGQHKFEQKPGQTKETCVYCGAKRVLNTDPNICNHDFIKKEGSKKLRCKYCNTALPIKLTVQDIETVSEVQDIKPKKKSLLKRLFGKG